MKSIRRTQAGLTLVELIITMALAGLVLAAILRSAAIAISGSSISDEASRLIAFSERVKSAYSARTTYYTGFNNTFAITNLGVADLWGVSGTTISSRYGNIVLAATAQGPSGAAGSAYRITYQTMNASNCTNLIAAAGPSFRIVEVGTTQVMTAAELTPNIATTTAACTAGGVVRFIGYI